MVAYFSAEKFESTPNPPGFPWIHPLLPSGTEGVWKSVCSFRAGFAQMCLRSRYLADMQAQVIAAAGMRLSRPAHGSACPKAYVGNVLDTWFLRWTAPDSEQRGQMRVN